MKADYKAVQIVREIQTPLYSNFGIKLSAYLQILKNFTNNYWSINSFRKDDFMQLHITSLVFGFIFVCGIYSTTFSQQMAVELEDLSLGADVIVTGKVSEQSSSWNEDNTRIYTRATIKIDEYLKGNNNGSTVVVTYLGGEVGDVGEMYSHMPKFEDQEEVLVFLEKDDNNSDYKVFYGEEGKISVINDPKTGEKITTSKVKINTIKAQIKSYVSEQK